jgi:phosphonoacetaldehyde hydrolase
MRIKAIIFDLGGTIVDTYSLSPLRSLQKSFQSLGYRISNKEMNRYMGLDKRTHIKSVLRMYYKDKPTVHTQGFYEAIYSRFKLNQEQCLAQDIHIIPGFSEMYHYLKENNIKIGVTTGYSRKESTFIMSYLRNQGYLFDSVVSSDEVPTGRGRPHPDMMYKNFKNLNLQTNESSSVLKVDDSPFGIEEGIRAGCITVGVARYSTLMDMFNEDDASLYGGIPREDWGIPSTDGREISQKLERVRKVLRKSNADYVIRDLSELPEVIENL